MTRIVPFGGGERFRAGDDEARLIVSATDTDGRYSLLEWIVAASEQESNAPVRDYGPHMHGQYEETFHVLEGSLEFLIGEEVVTLNNGDFVRVPPGVKHGYQSVSESPVRMLVMFSPGGMEELFLKYRTDQDEVQGPGFVADAMKFHDSIFGLPNPKGGA